MFKLPIAIAVAAAMLVGCNFDEAGLAGPESDQSLYQRLGTRETLTLQPTSLVGVAAYDDAGNSLPCLQPDVSGGNATLRTTSSGVLVVEALHVNLSDITVEPGIVYSAPIELTDIEFRLGTQLAIEPTWSDDGREAWGKGSADLLLDWALRDEGSILPLATQILRRVDFEVRVELQDDGSVSAEVMTAIDGRIGGFANRIELSDFSMAVRARSQR